MQIEILGSYTGINALYNLQSVRTRSEHILKADRDQIMDRMGSEEGQNAVDFTPKRTRSDEYVTLSSLKGQRPEPLTSVDTLDPPLSELRLSA